MKTIRGRDAEKQRHGESRRIPASPFLCVVLSGLFFAGCATNKIPPSTAAPAPLPGEIPASVVKPQRPLGSYFWPPNWPGLAFPKKPGPPKATPPQLIGTIKMVNTEDRFVLIDAVCYQGTEPGGLLVCLMNQQETANLRMSSMKNPPFLIADIASGTPSPGDRVFKP